MRIYLILVDSWHERELDSQLTNYTGGNGWRDEAIKKVGTERERKITCLALSSSSSLGPLSGEHLYFIDYSLSWFGLMKKKGDWRLESESVGSDVATSQVFPAPLNFFNCLAKRHGSHAFFGLWLIGQSSIVPYDFLFLFVPSFLCCFPLIALWFTSVISSSLNTLQLH